MKTSFKQFTYFCLFLMLSISTIAQNKITGIVIDASNKEPMSFASVGIPVLGIGTTTELDGTYQLGNIPDGTYQIVISYTGYLEQNLSFTVANNQTLELNVNLSSGVTLETVEITAQAIGQRAAINQQINANTIVNVISKEKLQELPDQNAAEAIGRLPGVAVQRDGGEGQKIVVRGLSPRFNSVTINGERMPSTDGEDRSVDLSMISPDMLAGVELFKAITPDMDADAIGGTVNFAIRKADDNWSGDVRLLHGYNAHEDRFGLWRTSFSLSNRFGKNNKFGVLATGNLQRADRSSDLLNAEYAFGGIDNDGNLITQLVDLNLGDRLEIRDRYGAGTTLDYQLKNGFIMVNTMWGRTERDELRRRRRFRPSNSYQEFDIRERQLNTNLLSNSITGEHKLGSLEVRWRASHSVSTQTTPFSLFMRFRETGALTSTAIIDQGPEVVPSGFKNDLRSTFLHDTNYEDNFIEDSNTTAQLDLKQKFNHGGKIAGYIKVGAKYREQARERDITQFLARPYLQGENIVRDNRGLFVTNNSVNNPRIYLANFLNDFSASNFLDNSDIYDVNVPNSKDNIALPDNLDLAAYNALFGTNFQAGDSLGYNGHLDPQKVRNYYERFKDNYLLNQLVDLEDYTAKEQIYAGYAMTEINFGKKIMFIGGVRYENTQQAYRSVQGTPTEEGTGILNLIDSVGAQGYAEFLPMFHFRYKATKWFDVRLAVTKTLSRPNYFNLVPWERINQTDFEIDRGKPDLKHTTNWNYDLFLSFYNKFGLFTIGGFYKQFDNVDYIRISRILDGPFGGYQLTEPANAPGTSTVIGAEVDLQANFSSLKTFWKGLLLGANFTIVRSETPYPFFDINNRFDPTTPPFFFTEVIDTVRLGRVPGQADFIANFQIGYERKGFSGRISAIYQANSLDFVGQRSELDGFTDLSLRWDLAINQRISKHWSVFFNLNNISNQPERSFVGNTSFVSKEEFFGWTTDLGFRYKF